MVANKLRTLLAMLGVIVGVGAVIAMLAIGAGAQQKIVSRIAAMGTNVLIVRPGQSSSGGVNTGTQLTLTLEDAKALVHAIPNLAGLSPVVRADVQCKHLNHNEKVTVNGVAATYFQIRNIQIESGRLFTEGEGDSRTRVAVLGPDAVKSLFDEDEDPVGQVIKIAGIDFQVIGVFKSKGDQGYFNQDDEVMVPYLPAMHEIFGQVFHRNTLKEIDLEADDAANLPTLQDDVTAELRRRHGIENGRPDDFQIRNQASILEAANQSVLTFRVLLGSIASISLLVGGIGIMNIMLVTVTERTREIGVRKAIGARDRDILNQFLIESVVLSGVGGIVGAALGVGMAKGLPLIPTFEGFAAIVQPQFIVVAVSFAAAVGVVFGVYPAWRASRLDPIEALRHE